MKTHQTFSKKLRIPSLPVVLLLALSAGCSKTTLQVKPIPSTVALKSLEIGPERGKRQSNGTYIASLPTKSGETSQVSVKAISSGGVAVEKLARVVGGQANATDLEIPSVIRATVNPPEATVEFVRIDGKPVAPKHGIYQSETFRRGVRIEAMAKSIDGVTDTRPVSPVPGEISEVQLHLATKAAVKVPSQPLHFDRPIRFDASSSSPSGAIREYICNFGDGEEPETHTEPVFTHVYKWKDGYGEAERFTVSLRVITTANTQDTIQLPIKVEIGHQPLTVAVDMYPSGRKYYLEGQEINFQIQPLPDFSPRDLGNLSFDLGDGTSVNKDVSGDPFSILCEDGDCNHLSVNHTYAKPGVYHPAFNYQFQHEGLKGPRQALLANGADDHAITVMPRYLNDDELRALAWRNWYQEFVAATQAMEIDGEPFLLKNKRLALACLVDANYEVEHPQYIEIFDILTAHMVKDGYYLLEKGSQALVSLAHDSVVDVASLQARGAANALTADLPYVDHMRFNILTVHRDPKEPLLKSIGIAGTKDVIKEDSEVTHGDARSESGSIQGEDASLKTRTESGVSGKVASTRYLSALVATFDTAENLILLKIIDSPEASSAKRPILDSGPDYHDATFNLPAKERTARVSMKVRILDRRSRVIFDQDIVGEATERVIVDFWEAQAGGQ